MKIGLIIFTKNEEKNSKRIFPQIPVESVDGTYVIDGKSTDGTRDFWRSKKIPVFDQKYPGVGGAYESAFRNTKEDALIFFHPDGNMRPRDIARFVKLLKAGHGFIIATRMTSKAHNEEDDEFFKPRKWFCQALGLMANIVWGRRRNYCTDITQGYRAFRRDIYEKLKVKIPNAIAPDFEQVIRALKFNVKITEFPTREGKRIHGATSMASLKTGWENIKVFLRELVEEVK